MKKIKYLLFVLFCVFLFPLNSNAQCDYQRMAELNKIASNVQISYSYELDENGIPIFYVNVSNVTSDIYVKDNYGNILIEEFSFQLNYYGGKTIRYDIYSNDNNCRDSKLTTKYVSLPYFNTFYKSDDCSQYPEFEYCNLWGMNDISQKQFLSKIEEYKDKNLKVQNIDEKKEMSENYILYIAFSGLIVLLILIVWVLRRKK